MDGTSLPALVTAIPGPKSIDAVARLARTECPAITARRARRAQETGVAQDPIVWEAARGANVRDVDGNVFIDFTSAFGVCGLGHNHPSVVSALVRQANRLCMAMGDVYPADVKIDLCDRLAEISPAGLERSILGLSGASAVEAALKTAVIHTGKPGVVAFRGGYHGLSIGALAATAYKASFRDPFEPILNQHARHVDFPEQESDVVRVLDAIRAELLKGDVGAVLLEPIQGRGGHVVPPDGFLRAVRQLCDESSAVLILDEIFTGFGRTGAMFACDHEGVVPDVLCVGKAMGGGFPVSAAIGTAEVMDSWGASNGESIHTQTFLGNPLGCAMALAALDTLVAEDWPARVNARSAALRTQLETVGAVRGRGYMLAVELGDSKVALQVIDRCRAAGVLLLPTGVRGDMVAVTPPFVATDEQIACVVDVMANAVR